MHSTFAWFKVTNQASGVAGSVTATGNITVTQPSAAGTTIQYTIDAKIVPVEETPKTLLLSTWVAKAGSTPGAYKTYILNAANNTVEYEYNSSTQALYRQYKLQVKGTWASHTWTEGEKATILAACNDKYSISVELDGANSDRGEIAKSLVASGDDAGKFDSSTLTSGKAVFGDYDVKAVTESWTDISGAIIYIRVDGGALSASGGTATPDDAGGVTVALKGSITVTPANNN